MHKYIIHFSMVFILLLLASCRSFFISPKEKSFKELFPEKTMNKNMRLWIGSEKNKLKLGEPFELLIENKTDKTIQFTIDNDIRLLVYDKENKEWNVVNNAVVNSSNKVIIPPISLNSPGINGVTILPDIKTSEQAVDIRIVIIGNSSIDNSEKAEKTSSFIDVTLQP